MLVEFLSNSLSPNLVEADDRSRQSFDLIDMDQRVQAVIVRLDEKISNKPPIAELADAVNLSPSHLRRLFKAETGIPLNQYIKSIRLLKSKELMEGTFLNMKQIMFAVGINDKSQFARDFKKLTGFTPTQYTARFRLTEQFKTNILSHK